MPLDPDPNEPKPISGAGGFIEIRGLAQTLRFDVSRWELEIDPRLIERTNTTPRTLADGSTATRIGTRYRKTVLDPSWKIECPWDENQTPASVGIYPGVEVERLTLHLGTSNRVQNIYLTTIDKFGLVNDARNDVVRLVASGKGGDMEETGDVEIPELSLNDSTSGVNNPSMTAVDGTTLADLFKAGGSTRGANLPVTGGEQ